MLCKSQSCPDEGCLVILLLLPPVPVLTAMTPLRVYQWFLANLSWMSFSALNICSSHVSPCLSPLAGHIRGHAYLASTIHPSYLQDGIPDAACSLVA